MWYNVTNKEEKIIINILIAIAIGAVSGWIAGFIMGTKKNLLKNIILGIVGGFVGGFVFNLLGLSVNGTIGTIVTSVVGACLVIFVARLITK